jgi:hypothetical protein
MATQPANTSVLSSWKEIASYFGKGVRTVQRWERELGLPVLRPREGAAKGRVIAHPGDLSSWIGGRWVARAIQRPPSTPVRDLREQIQTSRKLRNANKALVHEISEASQVLRATCKELAVNGNPPRFIS